MERIAQIVSKMKVGVGFVRRPFLRPTFPAAASPTGVPESHRRRRYGRVAYKGWRYSSVQNVHPSAPVTAGASFLRAG